MTYLADTYKINEKEKKASSVALSVEKEHLVIQYIPLVKYVVGRMGINLPPGLDNDDLVSIGCWGLIDAAKKFDENRGVQFKTYAMTRIRGSILDELRRLSLGGQALCRKAQMLEKAFAKVELQKGKPASVEEVAAVLQISKDDVDKLMAEVNLSFLLSLDTNNSYGEEGDNKVDTIVDQNAEGIDVFIQKNEQREMLERALDCLSDQEKMVINLYYYEELTLKEIAKILKVSESRISQIHGKAIFHLKTKLKRHDVVF
ncbi:MAG: FliA/WhiG family RNA polymerase sigma factor [Candidatus Margulisiibacteriota bacterium]|nr:MAG: hypothetical protein A2X43_04230 [Candidatus Margulisbacteria bacterium GWD2_39_127]OGI05207.1 MAG: hypothetical protein A2X42_02740 [Candidatus Margulisbacteria bacterium GWF2_38_17]OGI06256.1 MAG: hypothetical protein A2X41_08320 [Candidatus Margulisbacteria bacterium GWE2_39_32]PZM78912.1 MAG: FliA/WhiG family RNA polymerase sigma factor [Candidatus Margulisiibacteriota bacterium]HAR64504.1 FliA/WhiG family RNA polymerase sigma factor [Candidatus Margulisiibacteriota bacterium]